MAWQLPVPLLNPDEEVALCFQVRTACGVVQRRLLETLRTRLSEVGYWNFLSPSCGHEEAPAATYST
jgi:hypothetical protein